MQRKTDIPHLAARVLATPLLVARGKFEVILSVLAPRLGIIPPLAEIPAGSHEGESGLSIDEDGIAHLCIVGTLVQRASGMDAESGLTSYASIASDFDSAMSDPRVKGLLIELDSPGGEVSGLFPLADKIASASKPVFAVANESAFSAAYAIASAADCIYVAKTGSVGSIGVVAAHTDQSAFDEANGFKVTYVYAGARKIDGNPHQPLTTEAHTSLQADVDALYKVFVKSVSDNRGLTQTAVRETEAATFMSEDAVKAGLADRIGTPEDAKAGLLAEIHKRERAAEAHRRDHMVKDKVGAILGLSAEASDDEVIAKTQALADAVVAKDAEIATLNAAAESARKALAETEAARKALALEADNAKAEIERQKLAKATAEVDAAREIGAAAGVLMNDEDRADTITLLTSADEKLQKAGRRVLASYTANATKAKTDRDAAPKKNPANTPKVDLEAVKAHEDILRAGGVTEIVKNDDGSINFEKTQQACRAKTAEAEAKAAKK